jgi:hypothetical protein
MVVCDSVLSSLLAFTPAPVDAAGIKQSSLYTVIARACSAIETTNWKHPTRTVLQKDGVGIVKVELCNGGKYPVFTVHFKYDPQTATGDYFDRLYAQMAVANGFWSYSFVDVDDNVIIDVAIDNAHHLTINYENF